MSAVPPSFQGFSLSLTVPDDSKAERTFASLADGGKVQMPLTKTFFSSPSAWSPTASTFHGWSTSRRELREDIHMRYVDGFVSPVTK
jgi:hypothetical protein